MAIHNDARILHADIETAKGMAEVPFYQLKQQSKFINPDYVTRPVTIVCAAWKWHESNVIGSTSVLKGGEKHVVQTLADLINSADIIVAHNGDRFDWPMIKWRALVHGIDPIKEPKSVDTLKALKGFKPESRALRYVNSQLKISEKDESPDWDKIYQGDIEEIKKCERYCRGDIKALSDLYLRLRPWMKNHPHVGLFTKGLKHGVCSACGCDQFEETDYIQTSAACAYELMRCANCKKWNRGTKNIAEKLIVR